MNNQFDNPLVVFGISFLVLWLTALVGSTVLRMRRSLDPDAREDFGVILAATLTLLGLLIGFSFSMATSRYDQRKIYEEEEANAIETEFVRAGLLRPDDTTTVRALLEPTSISVLHSTLLQMSNSSARLTAIPRNCRATYGLRSRLPQVRSRVPSSPWLFLA